MKFRIATFVHALLLSIAMGGCGGGASGTGGIIGDLSPTQRIAEVSTKEKDELCARIVDVASDALKSDSSLAAFYTVRKLQERYLSFGSTTDANGYVTAKTELTPAFKNVGKDSFVSECRELFNSAKKTISTHGQCYDINQPVPSIQWRPPSLLEPGAFSGSCDLNNSSFDYLHITVGDYAACIDEYFNEELFSSETQLSCEIFYDLLRGPDLLAATDNTQFILFPPISDLRSCTKITEELGNDFLVTFPAVCDARPAQDEPYVASVFLPGG